MVKNISRRSFLESLAGAAALSLPFATSIAADGKLSDLELRIKHQIALAYDLITSKYQSSTGGTVRDCDPLKNTAKNIAATIQNSDHKTLKLEGFLSGLNLPSSFTIESKTIEFSISDIPEAHDPDMIYYLLDTALNDMAKEWAQEYKNNPIFRSALEKPEYSIHENCNLS